MPDDLFDKREKARLASKAYRQAHRDEINAKKRQLYETDPEFKARYKRHGQKYRATHQEGTRARSKAYYEAHKAEILARRKERWATDPAYQEKVREYRKAYYETHKAEIRAKERERWHGQKRKLLEKFMEGVGNG